MRIKSLKLSNWGPHKELSLDMDCPVFGLIGPNFSGKSNIMTAIKFAQTGLLDEKRTQQSYVRQAEGDDIANGSVEMTFVRGGVEGRIFRQVGKTPSRKLWWDGAKKPLTSAGEVDEKMKQILDCDKKALEQAVFLSQGHLADFLMGTAAERESDFARMCLIEHLAEVSDIAAQEILRLQKDITDLTSQRDEATQSKEQAEAALRTSESDFELYPDRTPELAWLNERIAKQQKVLDLETACQTSTASLFAAREQLNSIFVPTCLEGRRAESGHVLEEKQTAAGEAQMSIQKAETLERDIETQGRNARRILELSGQIQTAMSNAPVALEVQEKMNALDKQISLVTQLRGWQKGFTSLEESCASGAAFVQQVMDALKAFPSEETLQAQLVTHNAAFSVTSELLSSANLRLKLASDVQGQVHECCPLCGGRDLSQLPDLETQVRVQKEAEANYIQAEQDVRYVQGQIYQRSLELSKLESYQKALGDRQAARDDYALGKTEGTPAFEEDQLPDKQLEFQELSRRHQGLVAEIRSVALFSQESDRLHEEQRRFLEPQAAAILLTDLKSVAAQLPGLNEEIRAIADYHRNSESAHASVQKWTDLRELYTKQADEARLELTAHNRNAPRTLEVPDTMAGIPALKDVLLGLQERQSQRDRVQGMVRANTDALRRCENRLLEIEERARKNAATASVIGHLEDLKNAFGRNGIARHYLSKVFDALVTITQTNLSEWDTGFQVEKDPDNLFNFLFYMNERPDTLFDQSQMSGGQRTRVALSFVQALQQLLYPGLDFLCVDEPSNHLDAEGVDGLIRLFQTIALQNASGEAQVIVVDHNPLLHRAFSKVHMLQRL